MDYIKYIRNIVGHKEIMAIGVAILVLNEKDEVLLETRSDNGKYSFPGGALNIGEKVKVGKNQKTVLSDTELNKIVKTFTDHIVEEDFSVSVSFDQIKEKNYSFSAGQYFDVKIEYVELTQEEFDAKIQAFTNNLNNLFAENKTLEDEIKKNLKELKYEN